MKKYSVWVGGIEIYDYYLTYKEAKKLCDNYKLKGYKDTIIRKEL